MPASSSIVAAASARPGWSPDDATTPLQRRRGRIAGAIARAAVAAIVFLGNWWWGAEATAYARYVYKPLEAVPTIGDGRLHD